MIMSTPASRELAMPAEFEECVAVSLPNLRASSVIALSSSTLKDGRVGNEVRVVPPVATILM